MTLVELNPIGNFTPWDPALLDELKEKRSIKELKQRVLFENGIVRLWDIRLKPHERIPFHERTQYYSWTCFTGGLAISRNENGSIHMIRFNKGATHFWNLGCNGTVADLENIGEDVLLLHVIEYLHQPTNIHENKLESS